MQGEGKQKSTGGPQNRTQETSSYKVNLWLSGKLRWSDERDTKWIAQKYLEGLKEGGTNGKERN